MKKLNLLLVTLFFVPALAFGQVSETRSLTDFSAIEVSGSIDVEVTQADSFEVVVTSTSDSTEGLITEVSGNNPRTLSIEEEGYGGSSADFSVTVTLPLLESLEVFGSASADLGDFTADEIQFSVAGSGIVRAENIEASRAGLNVAGSGDILLASLIVDDAEINIAGSGEVAVEDVAAEFSEVNIAGSGDLQLAGSIANLAVTIAGSGDLSGPDLRVENIEGMVIGGGDVSIGEVVNGAVDQSLDFEELLGFGLDLGSMFDELGVEEEIDIELDRYADSQRHGRDHGFLEAITGFLAVTLSLGMPIIIVAIIVAYKYRKRRLQHETLRTFAENGQPVPENLMETLAPEKAPKSQLQSGINLLALGLGIAVFFTLIGSVKVAAFGCIPGFVGLAKILIWKFEGKE